MTVEMNQTELDLINKALEVWEKDAGSSALFGSMIGAMLCKGPEELAKEEARREEAMKKADQECKLRQNKSLLLRAKLLQASMRETEHCV